VSISDSGERSDIQCCRGIPEGIPEIKADDGKPVIYKAVPVPIIIFDLDTLLVDLKQPELPQVGPTDGIICKVCPVIIPDDPDSLATDE